MEREEELRRQQMLQQQQQQQQQQQIQQQQQSYQPPDSYYEAQQAPAFRSTGERLDYEQGEGEVDESGDPVRERRKQFMNAPSRSRPGRLGV